MITAADSSSLQSLALNQSEGARQATPSPVATLAALHQRRSLRSLAESEAGGRNSTETGSLLSVDDRSTAAWGGNNSVDVTVIKAVFLNATTFSEGRKYYCLLSDGRRTYSTRMSASDDLGNPIWNEYFQFPLAEYTELLILSVWCKRATHADECLGATEMPVRSLPQGFHRRSPTLLTQDMKNLADTGIVFKIGLSEDTFNYQSCTSKLTESITKHTTLATFVRGKVSKKKVRYQEQGFDLDLTYITKRVIAMGFPSSGFESRYRNPLPEVQRFFKTRHMGHFFVINLCSERSYPPSTFDGNCAHYGFEDHNPCPLLLLRQIVIEVQRFLDHHRQNVVSIHCKAGKGRTGLVICSWLVFSGICDGAASALDKFGRTRTQNNKGVTIPSQKRYVEYAAACLRKEAALDDEKRWTMPPERMLQIHKITVAHMPQAANLTKSGGGVHIEIRVPFTEKPVYRSSSQGDRCSVSKNVDGTVTRSWSPKDLRLSDDVKVIVYAKQLGKRTKLYHFWFNTRMHKERMLVMQRHQVDGAHKIKELSSDFIVRVDFEPDQKALERSRIVSRVMSEHSNFEGSSESLKMGLTVELKQNEHIMGQLQQYDEDIVWAGNVEKWSNGRSIKQARILVLGTKAVYNFKWKESTSSFRLSRTRSDMSAEDINPSECDVVLGWRRPYETLRWITCSRTSKEFIMHLPSEKYDYRYSCSHCEVVAEIISELIAVTSGRNQWGHVDYLEVKDLGTIHQRHSLRSHKQRSLSTERKAFTRNICGPLSRRAKPQEPVRGKTFIERWVSVAVFDTFRDAHAPAESVEEDERTISTRVRLYSRIAGIVSDYVAPTLRNLRSFRMRPPLASAAVYVFGNGPDALGPDETHMIRVAGIEFRVDLLDGQGADASSLQRGSAAIFFCRSGDRDSVEELDEFLTMTLQARYDALAATVEPRDRRVVAHSRFPFSIVEIGARAATPSPAIAELVHAHRCGFVHLEDSKLNRTDAATILSDLVRELVLVNTIIYEGLVNIKHNALWNPNFRPGVYFYRIARIKDSPGECELRIYAYSQSAPWEDAMCSIKLTSAKLLPSSTPLVSVLTTKDKQKYTFTFDSENQKRQFHEVVAMCFFKLA